MTDTHCLQFEGCKACTRSTRGCQCFLAKAFQLEADPIIHCSDNIARLLHTIIAVLSLSFSIRSQAVCSCVLVVIDDVPLVHPRSMHSCIKSFVSTIAVVLCHGVLAGTTHLLCLQLSPVNACPTCPVRLVVLVIFLGEDNAVLEAEESIWLVWPLPPEIQ